MSKKLIHRIYGILLSISAVIAGICLIAACLHIKSHGDHPFSAEAVSTAFSAIAVPIYIFLALIIGGFILDGLFPAEPKKPLPPKQHEAMAKKFYKNAPPELLHNKLRSKRLLINQLTLIWLIVGSLLFLLYALNGKNFALETINSAMIKGTVWLIVCMALPFCHAIFAAYYSKRSYAKEISLLKESGITPNHSPAAVSQRLYWIRWAILTLSIVMVVVGFVNNGTEDVLTKAVNICTECVGLG